MAKPHTPIRVSSRENTHFSFKPSGGLGVSAERDTLAQGIIPPVAPVGHLQHFFRMLPFRAGSEWSQALGGLEVNARRHYFAYWLSLSMHLFSLSLWESSLSRQIALFTRWLLSCLLGKEAPSSALPPSFLQPLGSPNAHASWGGFAITLLPLP